MARCKFCAREITWMKDGRRNRAVDGDGGFHACEEMKQSMNSIKKIEVNDLDQDILKQYEAAINQKVQGKK